MCYSVLEEHVMRRSKPITVTLGPQQADVDRRVKSGQYGSASEVLRSALRALDREDVALDDYLRTKVQASMKDPRPSVPAAEVFRRLRDRHARRSKVSKRGA
jgi:antitoxin ParD1/3/4